MKVKSEKRAGRKCGTCGDGVKSGGESRSLSSTMPSEQYLLPTEKLCSSCQSVLLDPISLFCSLCRDRPQLTQDLRQLTARIDQDPPCHEISISRRSQDTLPPQPTFDPVDSPHTYHSLQTAPPSPFPKKPVLSVTAPPASQRPQHIFPLIQPVDPVHSRPISGSFATGSQSYPDPLADVTRLRIRSRAHHCLYPGASFTGTQKSGRNSYDVNVSIVVCICLLF